jgi:hypothetical protein
VRDSVQIPGKDGSLLKEAGKQKKDEVFPTPLDSLASWLKDRKTTSKLRLSVKP